MSRDNYLVVGLPQVSGTNLREADEKLLAENSLLSLRLEPRISNFNIEGGEGAFKIFSLKPPGPKDKDAPKGMRIYFEPTTQIQETFTNNLTDHFLSQFLKTSERAGQILQTLGIQKEELRKYTGKFKEVAQSFAKNLPFVGGEKGLANKIVNPLMEGITASLTGSRFDFPKMWAESNAELTQTISFRLFCNNPLVDNEYIKTIVIPIENILKYVLPRSSSENSATYMWPFMCEVVAPGLFHLKEAMVTNVTFTKGPEKTFSVQNRPSIVDVSMTFTNIRNIIVNDSLTPSKLPYKLSTYISNLKGRKNVNPNLLKVKAESMQITSRKKSLATENISDRQKETSSKLQKTQPEFT